MLTSTTSKPVIYLTCSLTKSVTLRKILGADSPYSNTTFKSTAGLKKMKKMKAQVKNKKVYNKSITD